VRILLWHVHGAWTTAFVHGGHTYLVPATPDRDPYGLGRARTYPWPEDAIEVRPESLATQEVDAVVLQRPEEWDLAERWLRGLPEALALAPDRIAVHEDLPQARMHAELARRRVYLHPVRWTSLGLSLLEAMHIGMPVVALATTEAVMAVPRGAGVLSTDVDELVAA